MDTFEIKIKINDESELYNSFDPEQTTLNDELLTYLTDRYTEKEFKKKAVLVFSGEGIDGAHLKSALHRHVELELEKNAKQKKLNYLKQLRLFLIGLIFVAAGILPGKYLSSIPIEILSIIGSFAVWEAANIWIVQNPGLNIRKRLLKRLLDADIMVEGNEV
ncbi:MAG: hypothetical protein IJ766_06085 [Clostridia bacterium]|nr:hypothetical protein [Clostridia bacterium]